MSLGPRSIVGGKYEIIGRLGSGGMGTVFEARHTVTGRHVAVKVMHAVLATAERAEERFLAEARVLARLEHPQIVEVLDAGVDDEGRPFLVQNLLRGRSMRDWVKRKGRLTPRQILAIVSPVLRALAHAHERGFVHRDIKPGNIFLAERDEDGVPRIVPMLLDFGIAKLEGAGRELTETGIVLGTTEYLAPEQIEGEAVTARTDVWSMGVVMYEALFGKRPFDGVTPQLTGLRILSEEVSFEVSAEEAALGEVIKQCLIKKTEDRLPNAGVLRAALLAAAGVEQEPLLSRDEVWDGSEPPPSIMTQPLTTATADHQPPEHQRRSTFRPPGPHARTQETVPEIPLAATDLEPLSTSSQGVVSSGLPASASSRFWMPLLLGVTVASVLFALGALYLRASDRVVAPAPAASPLVPAPLAPAPAATIPAPAPLPPPEPAPAAPASSETQAFQPAPVEEPQVTEPVIAPAPRVRERRAAPPAGVQGHPIAQPVLAPAGPLSNRRVPHEQPAQAPIRGTNGAPVLSAE